MSTRWTIATQPSYPAIAPQSTEGLTASPSSPSLESRLVAWRQLWRILLTEPDDDSRARDSQTDPEGNDEDAAKTAA